MAAVLSNSVPKKYFISAIENYHPNWKRGTDERTITVYEILKMNSIEGYDIEVHLSLTYDPTGWNVTGFHFTIRKTKGDDANIWYQIIGQNEQAVFALDQTRPNPSGNLDLNSADIPLAIKHEKEQFDTYAQEFQKFIRNKF